ncbi:hypothetical protein BKP64_06770 [Marinobacter salinus]|uniref:Uncharacterized protein n=1 Tax=Marinobacter salinus TaxID=1874317 RepID=A0A1D9GJT5_9GAMM|nr:hypothetical protein BKP64_06770 [Marinobacter salinus]
MELLSATITVFALMRLRWLFMQRDFGHCLIVRFKKFIQSFESRGHTMKKKQSFVNLFLAGTAKKPLEQPEV